MALAVFVFVITRATAQEVMTLSLDEAVEIAMRQNPSILAAQQEILRTEGEVVEVRAQALPRAALASSYDQQAESLTNNRSGFGNSQSQSWRVAIEGEQLLYSGGQVRAALTFASLAKQSSFYSLRETIDTVLENVRRQYYQVLLAEALIRVQEESVELLNRELTDERNRFEAGTVPRFNVLRAEVEVANARPLLIRARNSYRIAQLELAKLLGIDFQSSGIATLPFNLTGRMIYEPGKIDLENSINLALERRAFLKIQRLAILQEVEQIKIAAAGYKPRLSAVGGYEVRSDQASDDLSDNLRGWFLGVRGSWNIFDGFETSGRLQQARARLETTQVNYEDSERQVKLEVQSAISRIIEAEELVQSQLLTIESADEALRLARERLAAGAGTQLEVLDARVSRTRAQITELEARFDYVTAVAELDRATGLATDYEDTFPDPLRGTSTVPVSDGAPPSTSK